MNRRIYKNGKKRWISGNARKAVYACAPRSAKQQGLRLIREGVRGGDHRVRLLQKGCKKAVAQLAGPILACVLRRRGLGGKAMQAKAVRAAELRHKSFVTVIAVGWLAVWYPVRRFTTKIE